MQSTLSKTEREGHPRSFRELNVPPADHDNLSTMPFMSAIDADIRLRNPTPLSEQEIHDLMEWMPLLSTGSVRRLDAESALKQLMAIKQFDKTSAKIGKLGLWLNGALFLLTVAAIIIAIASYLDANRSSAEQARILKEQKEALDASKGALENAVTVMKGQKELLEQSVAASKSELAIIQDQNRRALETPDIEAFFVHPQRPALIVHNKSKSKVARGVIYEARFWHLNKIVETRYEFVSSVVGEFGAVRPDGNAGPNALELRLNGLTPAALTEGDQLFGYVTVQCPECRVARCYWIYVEIGKKGIYREGSYSEFDFFHFTPDNQNKIYEFIRNGKQFIEMPMNYP